MPLFRGGEIIPFGIHYVKDGEGVTGLEDVTISIWQRDIVAGTKSNVVPAGSCSEVGDGIYDYLYTSAAGYYVYWAIGKTDGDVDQKHVAAFALTDTDMQEYVVAILADTGTDGVVLADNAITAAKIATNAIGADELAASATSEIAAAVWTYATRTLTSLGTLAADVWAYATRTLTQSAASVTAAVSGSDLTIKRGDTFIPPPLTGLGSIADRTKLWFTVKRNTSDPDSAAVIQIEETAGLLYINGAVATTPANGSITVNDEDAGDIAIVLEAVETQNLAGRDDLRYDIQVLTTSGRVLTRTEGSCDIEEDVTRAVT